MKYKLLYLLLGLGLLSQWSCASYKRHVARSARDWQQQEVPHNQLPVHQVYLLGDAGGSELGDTATAIRLYQDHLAAAPVNSTAVFLGDNIYPVGLAPHDHEDRELGEHRIKVQIEACRPFKGRPIFIPGNHDWYTYQQEGLKRQEELIEEGLEEMGKGFGNYFMPDLGCGTPLRLDIDEQVALLIIDSHWYLEIEEDTDDNPNCPGWNRQRFWEALEDLTTDLKDKEVIVVMHHPLYTNGKHGGFFSWKHHLFPLTEFNRQLWIPLPGIGSIYPICRRLIAVKQDVRNWHYQEMKKGLLQLAAKHGRCVFVAGHEHSLQYFEVNDQPCIVSGAGSKQSETRGGKGALFAYGHQGFARLDYFADGQLWLRYYAVGEGEVFRHKIR